MAKESFQAAIAVLIIASLGALMWVGFKALWENAEETTNSEIAKIGQVTLAHDEEGVGLVALPWGVLAYLTFLMLAVQVAVHLLQHLDCHRCRLRRNAPGCARGR